MDSFGRDFVSALATRDAAGVRAALLPAVDFKGLTPSRVWEAESVDGVLEIVFGSWFEEHDRITAVDWIGEDVVADTRRIGYRFDLSLPDGPHVMEQQAYYRAETEGIAYLRILCSGFRPSG